MGIDYGRADIVIVRTVKYINRRGVGKYSAPWINKSIDRFVLEAAANRHVHGFVIPPLHFLNEILASGNSPPFEWKPFEIDEVEYQQLVEQLMADPGLNVVTDNEFDNAKSLWDWKINMGKKYKLKKNRS